MATFVGRDTQNRRSDLWARLTSVFDGGDGRSGDDRDAMTFLAGAFPVHHRIVVADIGLGGPWSADALGALSSAVAEFWPDDVVAWDLAGAEGATSSARRIAADVDHLLGAGVESQHVREYLEPCSGGYELLPADSRLVDALDIENVLSVLAHHHRSVVVHTRHGDSSFDRMLDGAAVVVVPIPHSDAAATRVVAVLEELHSAGHAEWAESVVVVKYDLAHSMASSGSTEIRRTLGEGGVRTVLDVPPVEVELRRENDLDVARAWTHVASVVTRPRSQVRRSSRDVEWTDRHKLEDAAAPRPISSFEITTETLRSRSSDSPPRRRRGYLPVIAAVSALTVAAGLAASVLVTQQDSPRVAASAASPVSSSIDPARVSGPAVIAAYDDFYYRARDAAAVAELWELSDEVERDAAIADLQQSIDEVDPGVRHRIDVTPTSDRSVFDAVLTLMLVDGSEFRYDQQFTVTEGVNGFAIVGKIDCDAACPPP